MNIRDYSHFEYLYQSPRPLDESVCVNRAESHAADSQNGGRHSACELTTYKTNDKQAKRVLDPVGVEKIAKSQARLIVLKKGDAPQVHGCEAVWALARPSSAAMLAGSANV